jgi:hypothetical protein
MTLIQPSNVQKSHLFKTFKSFPIKVSLLASHHIIYFYQYNHHHVFQITVCKKVLCLLFRSSSLFVCDPVKRYCILKE